MARPIISMHLRLMNNPYYPKLDLGTLAAVMTIRQQMELFEDYLTHKDCPFDNDTQKQLAKLFAVRTVEKIVEKVVERKAEIAVKAAEGGGVGPKKVTLKTSGVNLEEVSTEIEGLRKELLQLKLDSKDLQTSDKIQIIKTRAQLVERLVSMDEKNNNLKRISLFQSTIMGILDDLMDSDRRLEFIARVQPFALADPG